MFLNVSCNLITPQPFIYPNKPILFFTLSFSFSIITWNTEYYFPKLGDFNALIKANGQTIKSTCESDMVVFLLQEVGAGYLDEATCGFNHIFADPDSEEAKKEASLDSKDKIFKNVRRGMLEFLKKNCYPGYTPEEIAATADYYDVSCKDMHGKIGTKSKFGHLTDRVNSQIAVVFNKRTNSELKYDTLIHKKQLTSTEKGGIIVEIRDHEDGTPKAAVIGVHLDSGEEKVRNLQICRIMKNLLKLHPDKSNVEVHKEFTCDNDHKKKEKMYALGTMVTELYPMGVFWTGDSNYRLPITMFGLDLPECPIDADADCKCEKSIKKTLLRKQKRIKHCDTETGKAKIITQLAKLGCGDPDALEAYTNGDQESLERSVLTFMGATVNQPYPNVPPRYVFFYVQYLFF